MNKKPDPPILSFVDFKLNFDTFDGVYQAIDGISFDLNPGESLGIVGETGCGKSVTAKSIMGLLPSPPAEVAGGDIWFDGRNLLKEKSSTLKSIRGNEISMIFQDPMTYLNPVFTIGKQIVDVIMAHQKRGNHDRKLNSKQAFEYGMELLDKVHLPNPRRQMESYPHELSGGMRQRVLIAMALSGEPKLLIADEPTTALDVTIQAQILELIRELREQLNLSVIIITHDLGVVATVCDRVLVMYAGQIVEDASIKQLFDNPAHPYTRGLLQAVPDPAKPNKKLKGIPGALPNLLNPPMGCRFQTRCSSASEKCKRAPTLNEVGTKQKVACWNVGTA